MAIDTDSALRIADTAARVLGAAFSLGAYALELRAKAIAGDAAAAAELDEMEKATSAEMGRWRIRRLEVDAAADAKLDALAAREPPPDEPK